MFRCCFCLYSFFLTVWKVHVIVLLLLWLWFLYMRGLVGNLLIWWRLHLNPVSFWYSLRSTVPPCMRHRQQWAILRALVVEIVSLENTLRTVSTGRQWCWIYVLYFYLPARGGSLHWLCRCSLRGRTACWSGASGNWLPMAVASVRSLIAVDYSFHEPPPGTSHRQHVWFVMPSSCPATSFI